MGNILYTRVDLHEGREVLYRLKSKDAAAMKNVWRIVEDDIPHYSTAFSATWRSFQNFHPKFRPRFVQHALTPVPSFSLFARHPQYRKFFEEELVPDFVQESKVRKKFFSVCSVTSALFAHYYSKPFRREYILGYIAMVHKDMGLSYSDLDNFVSDLLDTLSQELPNEMTPECIMMQGRCLKSVISRLDVLMKEQRQNTAKLANSSDAPKNVWRKICKCGADSVYGRPTHYWLSRKEYWEHRKSMWSVMGIETKWPSFYESDSGTVRRKLPERKWLRVVQRNSVDARKETGRSGSTLLTNRKRNSDGGALIRKHDRGQYNARSTLKDSRYRKYLQARTRLRQNSRTFTRYSYMDPIPEYQDTRGDRTSGTSLMIPRSNQSRQAFLEAVKALKTAASIDSNFYTGVSDEKKPEKTLDVKRSATKKDDKQKDSKTVDGDTPTSDAL